LVALTHSMFNRTNNDNGIVARLVEGDSRLAAMPLAVLALTFGVAVVIRHRLGRGCRLELDAGSVAASDTTPAAERPTAKPS
jgi:hypothetical protein